MYFYTIYTTIISLILNYMYLLWQPLVTKINDYTSGKSLNIDIKWEVHKRTQQGVC